MRQTRTTLFSTNWAELVSLIISQGLEVPIPCESEKQANSFRLRFYGYRSSLRRDPTRQEEANQADSVIATVSGSTVTFLNRDMTKESELLAASIRAALERSRQS